MEDAKCKVAEFLSYGSGYGYGNGDGEGSGEGYGYGYGNGNGYGNGYGYGDGNGDGDGDGNGDGNGDGDGYGEGYGYGDGYGDGNGDGDGYGDGEGSGEGYGYGDGYGYGSGEGSGEGDGNGDGDGYGYGSGDGYGDGSGYGTKSYNGQKVYRVDDVETIIYSVKNNIAIGAILNNDLTLSECYIAKVGNYFAHGETAHKAFAAAQAKALQNEPIEKRIKRFVAQYPDFDKKIPVQELFVWHNILTCSCEFGRRQFASGHGINLETDSFTVKEFIALTKDEYGGGAIKKLIAYGNNKTD